METPREITLTQSQNTFHFCMSASEKRHSYTHLFDMIMLMNAFAHTVVN